MTTLCSSIELIPSERGRIWMNPDILRVQTMHGHITVYKGFIHDLDTFVPNLWDDLPPIVHDFGYKHRIRTDGTELSRKQWDQIYRELNERSPNPWRRQFAAHRYWGLRVGGWHAWNKRGGADPIPPSSQHLYGQQPSMLVV